MKTALHIAAEAGNAGVVEVLLSHPQIQVNAQDEVILLTRNAFVSEMSFFIVNVTIFVVVWADATLLRFSRQLSRCNHRASDGFKSEHLYSCQREMLFFVLNLHICCTTSHYLCFL